MATATATGAVSASDRSSSAAPEAETRVYRFCIVASGIDPGGYDCARRLRIAGCSDATVSIQKGRIVLDFARKGASADAAIASAVAAVEAAGATVQRIEPDPFVTLAEIAARVGTSRAAISLYANGHRGAGFPPPAIRVTSSSSLWRWAGVARWLARRGKLSGDAAVEAEALERANDALRVGRGGQPA